ncbi:hydroxypyruvate isomerase [Rubritalea squalenifaciens DSM 18772]|uniref:Hydroxypyruvate isomerase n=1 Tax=Rubritalea squalenifaciens DSM 18772 TaxID=1123071 RepID=A0A1M6GK64_9BACT|nr:sugar phosphate isomerase/epimerase family protein [Rubritalea squalenifaciens]SHJ10300.1 hydroxypyruvate isomerase [Rubritalea squalenifaciens DSM 18772]
MNRRHFSKLLVAGASAAAAPSAFSKDMNTTPFKSLFAPHPGLLPTAPRGYVKGMEFAYELGFRAWEDNGLIKRSAKLQEEVAAFAKEKGITLGVTVISGGNGVHFATANKEEQESILNDMRLGVETAKRTGQTHMTMVPGIRKGDEDLDKQIATSADLMKRCCDIVEEHGIIMVLEPLSHGIKGGAPILRSFEDGFKLCSAVNRKSCKLLADFYHEGQIGNDPIPNAEKTWSQAAYLQYGDVPGRKEPGSGKLDYVAVTKWLRDKGYQGVIGMEHGVSAKGKEGLEKLMAAYRKIDA